MEDEGEEGGDDIVAGPELPPDEEEQLPDDDDEGRFFGGGITKDTADVMDFIDKQDKDETVRLEASSAAMEAGLINSADIREDRYSLVEEAGLELRKENLQEYRATSQVRRQAGKVCARPLHILVSLF